METSFLILTRAYIAVALALTVSVSIFFIGWRAQHLPQIGSAQQHKIPVHFITISMCFSSGLTSYCFYPFLTPATFVIIANPSVELTLETIARFVFHQFWYKSLYLLQPGIKSQLAASSHPSYDNSYITPASRTRT